MTSRSLVVSLHDVSPKTWPSSARILEQLHTLGIPRCSLLVIPDHHHSGHFLDNPGFCDWLRGLAADGHEIVMHGYYHRRERMSDEGLLSKLATRVYTADEGEFYDIDGPGAARLVAKAREEFHRAGLSPVGFIAPAWLLSAAAEAAIKDLGCLYTTRLGSVLELPNLHVTASQSLVWSVRSAWRRLCSRLWNAWLFRHLAKHPLLRISIHPVDLSHPHVWNQICDLLRRALASRNALTYQSWVENSSK